MREAFKLVKDINRKWQPKQTAFKDKEGNLLMDQNECLQRWTQYCSVLYTDNDRESKELTDKLVKISPPPRDNSMDDIMYEEVDIKALNKRISPKYDGIHG